MIKIFLLGLLLGVFFCLPLNNTTPSPVSSKLPEKIFPQPDPSSLTLIFTGDIMLGRSVNTRIFKYADPTWPFKNIATTLSSADLTIINLEAPFSTGCQPTDKGMIFCADPKSIAGLVFAGVDIASLANNHSSNQGEEGISETISLLQKNDITPIGLGKPVYQKINNYNLALIGFSDFPELDFNTVKTQIAEATSSSDLVITYFHWGAEYQKSPTQRQIDLAHAAIDSGADIVVGHHPHWTQTEEVYQGKPIYYSLGNLIFDQMWSKETRLGHILKLTYENKQLIQKEIIPVEIFDFGQPAILPQTAVFP